MCSEGVSQFPSLKMQVKWTKKPFSTGLLVKLNALSYIHNYIDFTVALALRVIAVGDGDVLVLFFVNFFSFEKVNVLFDHVIMCGELRNKIKLTKVSINVS